MKITFDAKRFSQISKVLSKVINRRSPLPVLSCINIHGGMEDDATSGFLEATNLEQTARYSLRYSLRYSFDEPGDVVLNFLELGAAVKAIGKASHFILENNMDTEGKTILSAGALRIPLQTWSWEEFPSVPGLPKDVLPTNIGAESFLKAFEFAAHAAATAEETWAVLQGIQFSREGLVATDGRRLAQHDLEDLKDLAEGFILPALTGQIVSLALKDKENRISSSVSLYRDESAGQVFFKVGNWTIGSRLLEGRYPNYQNLVPKAFAGSLRVQADKATESIKGILPLLKGNRGLTPEMVLLSGATMSISNESTGQEVSLPAPFSLEFLTLPKNKFDGGPFSIAFNARFLSEAFQVFGSEEVRVEFQDEESAIVIKGSTGQVLLMPVRIDHARIAAGKAMATSTGPVPSPVAIQPAPAPAPVRMVPVIGRTEEPVATEPASSPVAPEPAPDILQVLRSWRFEESRIQGVPAYWILSNLTMAEIADRMPEGVEQLAQVPGVGRARVDKYGSAILELIGRARNGMGAEPAQGTSKVEDAAPLATEPGPSIPSLAPAPTNPSDGPDSPAPPALSPAPVEEEPLGWGNIGRILPGGRVVFSPASIERRFAQLVRWREQEARNRDMDPRWVLSADALLAVAEGRDWDAVPDSRAQRYRESIFNYLHQEAA